MKRLAWLLVIPLLLVGGVTVKRGPGGGGFGVPGLNGTTGDDSTLAYLYALEEFQAVEQLKTQIWFDPYNGSDSSGDGTYDDPYRSFAKMKEECQSYTRCTVKGNDKVFSPLTLTMTGLGVGEDYYVGETLAWTTPAAGAGTVLDWYPKGDILVINRSSGVDPTLGTTDLTGNTSTAIGTVSAIANTVGGHVVNTLDTTTDVNIAAPCVFDETAHSYTNGQGPMRLFSSTSDLPAGFAEATDYYVCSIAANTFELDSDAACTGASITCSDAGTGIMGIAGYSNSLADDNITTNCADSDRICTLIEAESPEHPALLDGNKHHVSGYISGAGFGSPDGGVFIASSEEGWLGVQNFNVQNVATDALSIPSANVGKLIALRSTAYQSINGTENRTSTIATNNCITTHGEGALISINSRYNQSRVDSATGAGACIAPTETPKMIIIGGTWQSERYTANGSGSIAGTGGDNVLIGVTILSPGGGNTAQPVMFSNSAVSRLQMAKSIVLMQTSANAAAISLGNTGLANTVRLYESSLIHAATGAAFGEGIFVGTIASAGLLDFVGKGVLMDNVDFWVETVNTTSSFTNTLQFVLEGVKDDDDATGGGDSQFYWAGTGNASAAAAQSSANGFGAVGWSLYAANSVDSGGAAVDGTSWDTDTTLYRCQSTEECYGAYTTPYTIDLTNMYDADPNMSCIPADVIGSRICAFRFTPTNMGAR